MRRGQVVLLLGIVALAASLRLVALDRVPPFHADEAPNAWNGFTLLKTGQDQFGVPWPVFYIRAFGDYRTASYAYAVMPFQLLGGLNVWTTRLPAAFSGVLSVLLIYFVGARLFGRVTGLVAAAVLAVNPWHLQTTRWGHEASLVPFLVLLSGAILLWVNLSLVDAGRPLPRVLAGALAGAVCGVSCYGYSAIRLFLPGLLLGLVGICWPGLRHSLHSRRIRVATFALAAAFFVTFLPLAWAHWADPAINERARILGWVWDADDSWSVAVGKVALRYLDHFSPLFLFVRGDLDPALSPPRGFGLLHWYELPLVVAGVAVMLKALRTSVAARAVLLWLLLYPIGDILFPHVSSHSLRSLPGVGCFALLAAWGAVRVGRWLGKRGGRSVMIGAAVTYGALVLVSQGLFLRGYFSEDFRCAKSSLPVFGADILEASEWIRPRVPDADAVFITGRAVHPEIVALVGLHYDPVRWFGEPRELLRGPLPNGRYEHDYVYVRYGKVHFLHVPASRVFFSELTNNGRPDRVLVVVRPGQLRLRRRAAPVHEVVDARGVVTLSIFEIII